jgi:hypothetical protein
LAFDERDSQAPTGYSSKHLAAHRDTLFQLEYRQLDRAIKFDIIDGWEGFGIITRKSRPWSLRFSPYAGEM